MTKNIKIILLIMISFPIFFSNFLFGKTKLIATSKAWSAYTTVKNKIKTCFIVSEPIKSNGKYDKKNRGKPFVFVTNIKGGTSHEVSIVAGFKFKSNFDVILDIDGKKTNLFPVDDRAWSESANVDRRLVQSMRKGKKLKVTGTSTPGNKIIDTYSLSGLTKTLNLIDKSCS